MDWATPCKLRLQHWALLHSVGRAYWSGHAKDMFTCALQCTSSTQTSLLTVNKTWSECFQRDNHVHTHCHMYIWWYLYYITPVIRPISIVMLSYSSIPRESLRVLLRRCVNESVISAFIESWEGVACCPLLGEQRRNADATRAYITYFLNT